MFYVSFLMEKKNIYDIIYYNIGDNMKKIGRVILVVIFIFVLVGILFVFLNNGEDNVIGFFSQEQKEKENNDNKNGFYFFTDKLDKVYKLTNSCTISANKFIFVVVNKNYYLYKSNCLGVTQLKNGKTNDLKIYYDSLKEYYYLEYEGNKYIKDSKIATIIPTNNFVNDNNIIYIDNYKKLIEELKVNDINKINSKIAGLSSINFEYVKSDGYYQIRLITSITNGFGSQEGEYIYSTLDFNDLPDFSLLNSSIVIIENNKLNGLKTNNVKIFSKNKGLVYNLADVFPIKVNNVELKPDTQYIYVGYDNRSKNYVMFVSDNNKYCVEGSKEKNVAFYEFKLEVDYNNFLFKTPSFVRTWYQNDGCSRVKEIMEG